MWTRHSLCYEGSFSQQKHFENQFILSIYEYQKIIKSYDRSKLVPDAALRIGQAFKRIDKCPKSTPFFETIVEQYPRSPRAAEAKRELAQGCK